MSILTSSGRWPSGLAYTAALIFTLASAGTNLVYGRQKGTDLPSSTIWAAVSLAVAIVFALSWPAASSSTLIARWRPPQSGAFPSTRLSINKKGVRPGWVDALIVQACAGAG